MDIHGGEQETDDVGKTTASVPSGSSAGHETTTDLLYRHELRPVIAAGAEMMDRILNVRN